ncbi:hypothetical protein [Solimicrobium silvestre]|uniref:GreAB-C-like domain-containing protein n=1 Tax=Solimicrobium silvestre TaxID=2099400 RepID=A0A2S9GWJ7_9BURK|nr:hypothetical protein [Solimicrobium silvestre]PRC92090.1 hypothetical protein S2091_3225 [Solimicrobium silvestre]
MDNPVNQEVIFDQTILKLFPSSIVDSLISDSAFRDQYALKADPTFIFAKNGISVRRSSLFPCIREMLEDSNARPTLNDINGNELQLDLIQDGDERVIIITGNNQRIILPDFSPLSPIQSDRVSRFKRMSEEINFYGVEAEKWRVILESRALDDNELDKFMSNFSAIPITVAATITSAMNEAEIDFSSLVPHSEKYFERLVGECRQSTNIIDYAAEGLSDHINQLLSWNACEGFLLALLLSSHSSSALRICIDSLTDEDLVKVYVWLVNSGDRISQIGAIELGLTIVDQRPCIEAYLNKLIAEIHNDDANDLNSRFNLLSSLIAMVEGELARTKILKGKPPFWRRLASIAQASLIERTLIGRPLNIEMFAKHTWEYRGMLFYLQTMSDLRIEPRWYPHHLAPDQLKAECIGRIIDAANKNESRLQPTSLYGPLFNTTDGSLRSLLEVPFPFLPGPLEGSITPQNDPPEDILRAIKDRLQDEVLEPKSFAALVNSALLFKLTSSHAQLAIAALRAVKHQIKLSEDKEQMQLVLNGLATVAAVTRSPDLAEELKLLARGSLFGPSRFISPVDTLWIGLTAAAAHQELAGWSKFVGEWLLELACQSLKTDEISLLLRLTEWLCDITPELWYTCGRAHAALLVALMSNAKHQQF